MTSFGIGILVRFLEEMADQQLIVEEERVYIGGLRRQTREFAASDVCRFVARVVAQDRLLLVTEWAETNRKPYMICGRLQDPDSKLEHLQKFYVVERLPVQDNK